MSDTSPPIPPTAPVGCLDPTLGARAAADWDAVDRSPLLRAHVARCLACGVTLRALQGLRARPPASDASIEPLRSAVRARFHRGR